LPQGETVPGDQTGQDVEQCGDGKTPSETVRVCNR
jgi:hypothetical protein